MLPVSELAHNNVSFTPQFRLDAEIENVNNTSNNESGNQIAGLPTEIWQHILSMEAVENNAEDLHSIFRAYGLVCKPMLEHVVKPKMTELQPITHSLENLKLLLGRFNPQFFVSELGAPNNGESNEARSMGIRASAEYLNEQIMSTSNKVEVLKGIIYEAVKLLDDSQYYPYFGVIGESLDMLNVTKEQKIDVYKFTAQCCSQIHPERFSREGYRDLINGWATQGMFNYGPAPIQFGISFLDEEVFSWTIKNQSYLAAAIISDITSYAITECTDDSEEVGNWLQKFEELGHGYQAD